MVTFIRPAGITKNWTTNHRKVHRVNRRVIFKDYDLWNNSSPALNCHFIGCQLIKSTTLDLFPPWKVFLFFYASPFCHLEKLAVLTRIWLLIEAHVLLRREKGEQWRKGVSKCCWHLSFSWWSPIVMRADRKVGKEKLRLTGAIGGA